MGLDIVDVLFRLERTFRVKIEWKELEALGSARTPPDLLVEDVLQYVRSKWPPFVIEDGVIASEVACVACRASLRGIAPFMYCPDCTAPAAYEAQLRLGVRNALSDAMGVDPGKVTDEASLVRDLGLM